MGMLNDDGDKCAWDKAGPVKRAGMIVVFVLLLAWMVFGGLIVAKAAGWF